MSITRAFRQGKLDRQIGMNYLADFYGYRGISGMAYAIGRAI